MFSSTFAASATSQLLTGTMPATADLYNSLATLRLSSLMRPDHFGDACRREISGCQDLPVPGCRPQRSPRLLSIHLARGSGSSRLGLSSDTSCSRDNQLALTQYFGDLVAGARRHTSGRDRERHRAESARKSTARQAHSVASCRRSHRTDLVPASRRSSCQRCA